MEHRHSKSLTEEVDDLAIAILKIATSRDRGDDGSPSASPTRRIVTNAQQASSSSAQLQQQTLVDISAVTTDDGGKDVSPIRSSVQGLRRPLPGISVEGHRTLYGDATATGGGAPTPTRTERHISAIMMPPGGMGQQHPQSLHVPSRQASLNASPFSATSRNGNTPVAAPRASPLVAPQAAGSTFPLHRLQASSTQQHMDTAADTMRPRFHDPSQHVAHKSVHGVYEATMEQVAENMTRLVRSAALLEAESRLVSDERAVYASSSSQWHTRTPASGAVNHNTTTQGSGNEERRDISPRHPRASPLSRTMPPPEPTFDSTSSSSNGFDGATTRRLEVQVQQGRQQTKDLIHELHLLELRLQRELQEKDRVHERERDAWRESQAVLQVQAEELTAQVRNLKSEKEQLMQMLKEMGEGRMEAHETVRTASIRLQQLEAAHDREIQQCKRDYDQLKEQNKRLRQQRDLAERNLTRQGHNFSLVAENVLKSDSKMKVLQSHIHDLHIRDQQKDEHLHDVAVFVKRSLAPFVLELEQSDLAPPTAAPCRHCVRHHAAFDAKPPRSASLSPAR